MGLVFLSEAMICSTFKTEKTEKSDEYTDEIMETAYDLFCNNYDWKLPIRSLGIRRDDLVMEDIPIQLDLFLNEQKREKLDAMGSHTVHPIGYFNRR